MLAGIPLRGLDDAKTRLSPRLAAAARASLVEATARRVVAAASAAGFAVAVVTGSEAVRKWCESIGVACLDEPTGGGLDGSAAAIVAAAHGPWCVIHGDLPLITAADLRPVRDILVTGATALAPSRDGGTNLIGGTGPFSFSYGPGSFARHLAAAPGRTEVLVTPGLAVELDTVADLASAARLREGDWLRRYLT